MLLVTVMETVKAQRCCLLQQHATDTALAVFGFGRACRLHLARFTVEKPRLKTTTGHYYSSRATHEPTRDLHIGGRPSVTFCIALASLTPVLSHP
jgi:hypothetical protein